VTVRAIFFDFGGVLGHLDEAEMRTMEAEYGLPENGVLEALYRIPEWGNVQVGKLPEADWLEAVGAKLDELAGRPIPASARSTAVSGATLTAT
jgi:hypothetical protein